MTEDSSAPAQSPKIDTTVPHSARIWNYWLGGRDNYPVDQEAGEQYAAIFPGIIDVARVQRHFLARAVRFLAGEGWHIRRLVLGPILRRDQNSGCVGNVDGRLF